jgi:hypothetical protein
MGSAEHTEDSLLPYGRQPIPGPLHTQCLTSMSAARRSQPEQLVSVMTLLFLRAQLDQRFQGEAGMGWLAWAVCGGMDSPRSKLGMFWNDLDCPTSLLFCSQKGL